VLSILLLSVANAESQEGQKSLPSASIIIGLYDLRPYSYLENDQYKGEWVELYHLIFKDLGIDYRFSILPPKRLILQIRTGDVHVTLAPPRHRINDTRTTLRGHQLITNLQAGIISTSRIIGSPQTILNDNKVLSIRGYNYDGISDLAPRENLAPTRTHLQMVRLIISGRYKYGLSYKNELLSLSERDRKKIQFHKVHQSQMHFLTSLKAPDAETLSKQLDQTFMKLRESGALNDCCQLLLNSFQP
jgi:hypothetical protein